MLPSILCRHNARLVLVLDDEIDNPVAISQPPSCSAVFGNHAYCPIGF
jgi:hypothetical protein